MRRIALLVALAGASACDDSFIKGWLVDRTRVLGARVEAVAEPGRASLAPGEPARITWLVGRVDHETPPLGWAYALCAGPKGVRPETRCEGPVFAAGSGTTASSNVAIDFVAPPAEATGDAGELVVVAAFCEGGTPALDAARFEATCAGEVLLASATVRLAAAGANRNPEVAAVTFDGAPIADDVATCPVAAPGSKHGFGFAFRPEDREAGESLLATHVVNAGELDRQFSALEADEAAPKAVAVEWTAPAEPRRVDFYFVLRDGRGGMGFVRRTVCVR